MDKRTLKHSGIKGMKWGVRRYQNPDGSLTPAGRKRYGGDSYQQDPVKSLSDAELRQRINRIQMENTYAQLTAKKKSAGRKFVEDVLLGAAKQTATSYAAKYMTKGVDALMNSASKTATKKSK